MNWEHHSGKQMKAEIPASRWQWMRNTLNMHDEAPDDSGYSWIQMTVDQECQHHHLGPGWQPVQPSWTCPNCVLYLRHAITMNFFWGSSKPPHPYTIQSCPVFTKWGHINKTIPVKCQKFHVGPWWSLLQILDKNYIEQIIIVSIVNI